MLRYILKRFLQLVITLFFLTFITFTLSFFLPSDPIEKATANSGVILPEEVKESMREEWGLNDSYGTRYINWLSGIIHGDFGKSIRYNVPVWQEMKPRLVKTGILTITSFLIMLVIAIPLGSISALYNNRPIDYIIRIISFMGLAFPSFLNALLLMYIFGFKLRVINILSSGTREALILPSVTLAIGLSARYIRWVRTNMLEELAKEYVIAMVSNGVPPIKVIYNHVLPNVLIPILPVAGMSLGSLFGGTAIVESIFNWQGVGYLAVNSVQDRDYNVIQAYAVWMGIIFIGLNLVIDIINHWFDPKLRMEIKNG